MIALKQTSHIVGSLFLASTLVACGASAADEFAEMPADEIVKASIADMEGLKAVQVQADIESDDMEISLDLQLAEGGNCTGTVGVGGAMAEVLSVDGTAWFKPDADFFAQVLPPDQVDAIAGAVDGKYIEDAQGQFSSFCDLDELLENITDFNEDDNVEKGDRSEVDGEDAIVIEGETDDGGPSQAFIATGERHYILKFTATGDAPGEVTFSKFDEAFDVTAPDPADVVDLDSLG